MLKKENEKKKEIPSEIYFFSTLVSFWMIMLICKISCLFYISVSHIFDNQFSYFLLLVSVPKI